MHVRLRVIACAGFAALLPALGGAVPSALGRSAAAPCVPRSTPAGTVMCGPARATLSVFPGATFKPGTCQSSTADGQKFLTLQLGEQTTNPTTNNGKAYLQLMLAGASNGHVTAFWKGKHWAGTLVSIKHKGKSATFVVKADPPGKGKATGSYTC